MAKKRKTLPKDFDELLVKGNLDELKAVFDKCELDARGGYSKETALAYDKCPHELAQWLVEQGADLHATDTYGNTPLHSRARSVFGNIKSLLDLGADVNSKTTSDGTPLHAAANGHNVQNTELLLAYGARVDEKNASGYTPMEQALRTCSNIDIAKTAQLAKIYLDAGAQLTPRMKGFVEQVGKSFEFHRANFNKDSVQEVSDALEELYRIVGTEAVAKRVMHDGKSPITTSEKTWQKQHTQLWDFLVPSSGAAQTMQGDELRNSGRIANELDGNGGINWDSDYKKMADAFLAFVKQGNALPSSDLAEAENIIQQVKRKAGETSRLCELGVQWVIANPTPVQLPPVEYER